MPWKAPMKPFRPIVIDVDYDLGAVDVQTTAVSDEDALTKQPEVPARLHSRPTSLSLRLSCHQHVEAKSGGCVSGPGGIKLGA